MSAPIRPPLPVDAELPRIVAALRATGRLVLRAPPGSGKTTRVPPALLEAGLGERGQIVVLQPRRLAARLAARQVAAELGEPLGERVGYQVRHEQRCSAATRLLFVTQGLFLRRLLAEPELPGVAVVLLDEFHERHLDGDLILAALWRLMQTRRPELRLAVLSATLEVEPVARHLGSAPVVEAGGRCFEVRVEHAARSDETPLAQQVRRAVARLLCEEPAGDVLVFVPGAAEIRRAREALAPLAAELDVELCALHGDQAPEQQERAVRPGARRKVILSTNVAESSVTVEGVVAVVDSGLARVPGRSPWSGLPSLELRPIAQASAIQRAGRAGRLRAGRCLRLYTLADLNARPPQDAPEIARLDLAELWLQALHLAGDDGVAALPWLDPPPAAGVEAAMRLLQQLDAVEAGGRLTPRGRALLRLPLHPRLGRLLDEARRRGVTHLGCAVAALLSERDVVARGPDLDAAAQAAAGEREVLERLALLEAAERERLDEAQLRARGLVPGAVRAVQRTRAQLEGLLGLAPCTVDGDATAVLPCLLAAFSDRVAQRRPGSRRWLLCGGGEVELDAETAARAPDWLVVVDALAPPRGRAGVSALALYSPIAPDWLLDLEGGGVHDEDTLWLDEARGRVVRRQRLRYGLLTLTESAAPVRGDPRAAALLATHALQAGPATFAGHDALADLAGRLALARRLRPELDWPALDDALLQRAATALALVHDDLASLRRQDLGRAVLEQLAPALRQALARLCPEHIELPGRRRAPVRYPVDAPAFVASAIQDFFGLGETPRIGGGQVPLQLHLLAPSRRPVQQTQDLAGFWDAHYPALRRELSRRYPRHVWPEDPRTAKPPSSRRR